MMFICLKRCISVFKKINNSTYSFMRTKEALIFSMITELERKVTLFFDYQIIKGRMSVI